MATSLKIPKRLPLLIVSENVLLPGASMRIPVRNMRNMNMVKSRLLGRNTLSSTIVGIVPKEPGEEGEDYTSIHSIGTAAVVVQVTGTNWPQPAYTLLVTGLCRFKVDDLLQETPYLIARVTQLDKLPGEVVSNESSGDPNIQTLVENFRDQAFQLIEMLDISIPVVAKLKKMLDNLPGQHLPDLCASIVKASYTEKLSVLDAVDLNERFKKTLPLLMRQIEGLQLLQRAKKDNMSMVQRKQLTGKPINMKKVFKQMNDDEDEDDEDRDEIADLEHKIKACKMTPEAQKNALKELRRLRKMPQQMPEHAMLRSYLDLMVELPWAKTTTDCLDIIAAKQDLDEDHYGLEKLKKRVIEYLAVRQLKNTLRGPILCFVGPPGVGKTSVGRSIAQTLGRTFHRIALGGVCDQSDIRGHRRTYIGSMPGRIIQGLKLVGTKNPVFLLDEIDKLGASLHGDPAAALLEVLDPEQNHTFVDHYLNVPFDLSQVLFIATANTLQGIPPALIDRMEIIEVPGYTQEEKIKIAMRHLLPKQLKEHGLVEDQLQIPEDSVKLVVSKYTREAGVRRLERKIGAMCRAVAVKVASNTTAKKVDQENVEDSKVEEKSSKPKDTVTVAKDKHVRDSKKISEKEVINLKDEHAEVMVLPPEMPIVVDEQAVEDILGPPMFESETSERLSQPGVAVGLAWTANGGEIMFVESTKMEGSGELILTGQLGDVMKESASIALNWVRSNGKKFGLEISKNVIENTDIHIHFPAGAVGKDGPSAGVTICSVLVSLFSERCVRSDTAMTGEVTLRGLVLPIGGVKEKVLAAHRAGIKRVILPHRNMKDLHEVPTNVKEELSFIFARTLEDVLNAAFEEGFPSIASLTFVDSKL